MSEREQASLLARLDGLYDSLAKVIGSPERVWCRKCGLSQPINAAQCLRSGWPKCCGCTMTIDPPAPPETPDG